MVKFFYMPKEVWYYVVIPIAIILLVYFLFWIFYRNKKESYYYNYVVDYVYSTLGIVFCSLLLSLLLGYSIATVQLLLEAQLVKKYLFLIIILIVLPIFPTIFLVYVLKVYIRNLKRKKELDLALENTNNTANNMEDKTLQTDLNYEKQVKNEIPSNIIETPKFEESDFELKKKN